MCPTVSDENNDWLKHMIVKYWDVGKQLRKSKNVKRDLLVPPISDSLHYEVGPCIPLSHLMI